MTDVAAIIKESPVITFVASAIAAIILWLVFAPQYKVRKEKDLTSEEKEERLAAWRPKPIVPETFIPEIHAIPDQLIVASSTGAVITTEDGKDYLNFTSGNYLGLASCEEVKHEAKEVIKSYGVGSCGPRGFYGTIDLHLLLEETFARFMGTEAAILYSDGMACLSSVIPAFSKAGDYIIVDKDVNCGIQQGLKLSRSKVSKFEHNDMESLEARLRQNDETMAPHDKVKYRRFIVVEGIYSKTGSVCPLAQVVKLAQKYKFRVILDDSNAIGVLGKTGRGSIEHWGLKVSDIELLCATLDNALGSVGGVCLGFKHVISHQRLSGSGYCFSAASPPYTARVASYCLGLVDSNPNLLTALSAVTKFSYQSFFTKLQGSGLDVLGNPLSPIIVLRPSTSAYPKWTATQSKTENNSATHAPQPYGYKVPGTDVEIYMKLKKIAEELRSQHNIVVSVQHRALQEEVYPWGLKVVVTTLHSEEDIAKTADLINTITQKVLSAQ